MVGGSNRRHVIVSVKGGHAGQNRARIVALDGLRIDRIRLVPSAPPADEGEADSA